MREKLMVEGKEVEDQDLRKLAASLEVGQKITGKYRYFLFGGATKCDMSFDMQRLSPTEAVMFHLNKAHQISIAL